MERFDTVTWDKPCRTVGPVRRGVRGLGDHCPHRPRAKPGATGTTDPPVAATHAPEAVGKVQVKPKTVFAAVGSR